MTSAPTTSEGAPVISLERTVQPDSIAVVWKPVQGASPPVIGYDLYVNGAKFGSQIVPDDSAERCRVVLDSCKLNEKYNIMVAAVSKDEQRRLLSNELSVTLPVDTEDIMLPADVDSAHDVDGVENKERALLPADENLDDVYKEVLKIQPGSPHDEDEEYEDEDDDDDDDADDDDGNGDADDYVDYDECSGSNANDELTEKQEELVAQNDCNGSALGAVTEEHTSNVDLSRENEDDVSQNTEDDMERLQQQEFIHQSLDATTAPDTAQAVDSLPPADQLEGSKENDEDAQQIDGYESQQLLYADEVTEDKRQQQLRYEEGKSESQNHSVSANAQQTVEENERQSPQQLETEQPQMSHPQTINSQVQEPSWTQTVQQAERRAAYQQTVHTQVQSKTSTSPEKKQQVAVVHGHERSYPRAEDRALSRIRDEERMFSMSRQPTLESYLSIDSTTSSHQLSQASLLWQNEQSQATTRQHDIEQTVSMHQQYEELKYQLHQQLELQRSQLEREYQLREEQMKQQMIIQRQNFTQQQQQQPQQQHQPNCRAMDTQMFSDVRQDTGTRCQSDPRCFSNFPRAPTCTYVTSTCNSVSVQHAYPLSTQLAGERQRCGCDNVVQSNARYDARAVPAKLQQNCREVRPVVVDVISRTRGLGSGSGAGRGGYPGYDGGHCRIIVGELQTTLNDDGGSDVESVEVTGRTSSEPVEWRCCPTCGLGRHPYDTSDGKDIVELRLMDDDDPRCVHVESLTAR